MKSVLIAVTAGLLLAVGLAAAESRSGAPKAHFVVLRIEGSGERTFVADTGPRKGYLYIGLPIGSVAAPSPSSANASAATLGGVTMDAGTCPPGTQPQGNACVPRCPLGQSWIAGKCQSGGYAVSVVCEPAVCNPPGPIPAGDFHFPGEELSANLKIFWAKTGLRVESSAH